MENFPLFDMIPLPAPVVVLKVLLILTSCLHFAAVEIFLGGLLIAVILNRVGQAQSRYSLAGSQNLSAAWILAKRLPVVMTFLINLAVAPLLFSQVLYGPALYTSSILLGVYWIAVIGLLMLCYWLLYKFSDRCSQGDSALWVGLGVWLTAAMVGKILSLNMTLMLRPEVWSGLYAQGTLALSAFPHDPTLLPRWAFMILGGLVGGGAWMLWLGSRPSPEPALREYLSRLGGYLLLVGIPIQLLAGYRVWSVQPDFFKQEALESGLFGASWPLFVLCWAALWALAWNSLHGGLSRKVAGNGAALLGTIGLLFVTIARDAIRDITLAHKGFDIWTRSSSVQTNLFVLALFLFIFVAGLALVGWLLWVSRSQRPVSDRISERSSSVQPWITPQKTATPTAPACSCPVSRSTFLSTTLATVGLLYAGGLSYGLYRYLGKTATQAADPSAPQAPQAEGSRTTPPSSLLLKGAATLPVQSMMTFTFRNRFSLLIHHADHSWVALDGICTHQGCKVRYEPEKDRIFCPCHSGVFDAKTGTVLSGPPKAPLPLYQLEVQGDDILIS